MHFKTTIQYYTFKQNEIWKTHLQQDMVLTPTHETSSSSWASCRFSTPANFLRCREAFKLFINLQFLLFKKIFLKLSSFDNSFPVTEGPLPCNGNKYSLAYCSNCVILTIQAINFHSKHYQGVRLCLHNCHEVLRNWHVGAIDFLLEMRDGAHVRRACICAKKSAWPWAWNS